MPDFAARRTMMVNTQVRPADVTSFPLIEALLSVPREEFFPVDRRELAYVGENQPIAPGRVMLDPRTLAKMLETLDIQPTDLVLDVGAGRGYSTAVIARLAEAVVGVEELEDLAADAEEVLLSCNVDNAAMVTAALTEGAAQHGPYDAIIVQGGVQEVPQALIEQLKDGGRFVCLFMEQALGTCRIGHKRDGEMNWRYAFNATAPILSGFERKPAFAF